ncbi:MAG: L-aspartate oxidase [Acidimicrobiales bacterium]
MTTDLDLLVLGSGVAGLSAAVRAASEGGLRVGVLTKGELEQSATRWAQGGIAAVLGGFDTDSTDLHLADTLSAGAGLCDVDAVRVLVDEGPGRVNDLIALGAVFDADHEGRLLLAREGGHSVPRVVHAGGAATGVEIERALVDAVHQTAAVVFEHTFAFELIVEGGVCRGVHAVGEAGEPFEVRSAHTLMATGGAGQLFAVTTNPAQSTGDGIAMALRAGVAVADVEFMQFHPTALHHPAMPRPLLSEALRGHGALLRDADGKQFVDELQPRDVVSRAMAERMLAQGVEYLWLDATGLDEFAARFPTIDASVRAIGLDPTTEWLPIAPAAHSLSGGVITDLDGASSMPGLWAAGETSCSGVHGANRLASNSLLDGMVFGARVVEAIAGGRDGPLATGAMRAVLDGSHDDDVITGAAIPLRRPTPGSKPADDIDVGKERDRLQRAMTAGAGVRRDADSLGAVSAVLDTVRSGGDPELSNLTTLARAVIVAALAREESRGAHFRVDFPERSTEFRRRLVLA